MHAPRQPPAAGGSRQHRYLPCQYHHWEYGLDGAFVRIPDLDTFPQGAPPCRGLAEIPCDTWGGFVWFSLNPQPIPLREYLDPIPAHLDPYNFHKMALTRDITIEWDCNWKTSVDAFNESYHVQGIHPQPAWYLHDLDIQIDCYERHNRYLILFATWSPRVRKPPSIPDPIKVIMKAAGMDPADYDAPLETSAVMCRSGSVSTGPAKVGLFCGSTTTSSPMTYHYLIFPNVTINVHADDLMLFRQRLHPENPTGCSSTSGPSSSCPTAASGRSVRSTATSATATNPSGWCSTRIPQPAGRAARMHSAAYAGLWLGSRNCGSGISTRCSTTTSMVPVAGRRMRYDPSVNGERMPTRLDSERLIDAYRRMKTIREFEERLHVEIATGEIPGFTHLYAGQEAVAVGVCAHLDDRDYLVSTHRTRSLHRQGLRRDRHDARDLRAPGRAVPRQGQVDAHRRCGARDAGRGRSSAADRRSPWCSHRRRNRGDGRVSVAFGGDGKLNQGTVFEP